MACITKQGVLFLQEAQKLGWKPQFIAMSTLGDPITADLAGPALDGVVISLVVAVDTMNDPNVMMANQVLAKYYPKIKPGYWAYLGMAGAMAFVEAAKRAGPDLTRAKLIAALESMHGYSPGSCRRCRGVRRTTVARTPLATRSGRVESWKSLKGW